MKLYKRYSRLAYRRIVNPRREKLLRWGLSIKPGDIINDCSGFNKIIRSVDPYYKFSSRGWAIIDVDYTTEPHGGGCSLTHCGVEPAIPRDVLESEYVKEHDERVVWMRQWFKGSEEKGDKAVAIAHKRVEVVRSGGHFLDEQGILPPEFEYGHFNGKNN